MSSEFLVIFFSYKSDEINMKLEIPLKFRVWNLLTIVGILGEASMQATFLVPFSAVSQILFF